MNRGISLYLAVLVMIVLLSVILGLSTILLGQIKMIGEMNDSVIAFSAADAGIEAVLYLGSEATTSGDYSGYLDNNASWVAKVINRGDSEGGVKCPDDTANFCIHTRGIYEGIQRAIQITR